MTRQAKANRTKAIKKMSSIEVRLMTIARPSMASRNPASVPSRSERNILRTVLARTRTLRVPKRTAMMRNPNGLIPKICSPIAITHLPSGGCVAHSASVL